jgi:hypothetical protein
MNKTMKIQVEIVVVGHLPPEWSEEMGGLDVTCQPNGNTNFSGTLPDQAALYGLLTRLRDFGLALVLVRSSPYVADAVIKNQNE